MTRLVILLLLASTVSVAEKLTELENEALQENCGRNNRYRHKVINGDVSLDFPSAASVHVKSGILTSTIISPRHVILFNIFEFDKITNRRFLFNDTEIKGTGYCIGEDWILPEEVNDMLTVNIVGVQGGINIVSRVFVLGGCVEIDTYKPMIIELSRDFTYHSRGSVCLPQKEEDIIDAYTREDVFYTVYGLGPKGDKLTSAEYLRKEECDKEHESWHQYVFCGKPVNESRGLCAGDFGGGAIANVDGRNTIFGVYAEGNVECGRDPAHHPEPEFIDLAKYTKSICRHTGVCPDFEEDSVTPGVYVPAIETEATTEDPTTTTEYFEYTDDATEFPFTEQPYPEEVHTKTPESANTAETIVAETFEKMLLNCSAEAHEQPKEIHIHIHLDKDATVHFD
ncbi:hypothetical protein B9Z55_017138 [Caenorhabditis nigoni]|uniref:Peptidase S1 domain-containing protein n=1 Tax=Caenorhabditis nigoni TaxID=1611254 RepID=A0A2G5T8C1_9PELO|nr:hypothetical protein B9Z55_017138 [Caenorhabditis nigoni]